MNSIVCEVQAFEEGSCPYIEESTDAVSIENEVRSNLSNENRRTFIKLQKEDEILISIREVANKKEKAYEIQDDIHIKGLESWTNRSSCPLMAMLLLTSSASGTPAA
ncbi:hypothetical protein TNIN_481171 [Trichonephila inaurata madagascariensis]|uniref:Uncharacterized protein n=1 Tax=Trichonephila inaurata madagascariensis TaxID=2747483 RepID=A0A8X6XNB9_9ARAC|nr:hypothetical protein TNIN_481171 [Trichonephila inaurata madagascariensis]